jgi:SAM-dependent methyltransferase
MEEIRNVFLDSLDLDDSEIVPYIPEILKNLWELGSMPDYVIDLVEKHIPSNKLDRVIDLGCGKGAVLIQLSEKNKFEGIGIDLMPEFIDEAKKYAVKSRYSKDLVFEVDDIKKAVEKYDNFDLIFYAHDSDIFGGVTQSLLELKKYMSSESWIIFETIYSINHTNNLEELPNKDEFIDQIEKSGLDIVDQIIWDKDNLRKVNKSNTILIDEQIKRLIKSNPTKEKMFANYLKNQIDECRELENDLECVTIILKNKTTK